MKSFTAPLAFTSQYPLVIFLILAGVGIIFGSLVMDLIGMGGQGGFGCRQIVLLLGGAAVFLSGIILLASERQRSFFEWIWLGIIAIGVASAASMIIDTGLPKFTRGRKCSHYAPAEHVTGVDPAEEQGQHLRRRVRDDLQRSRGFVVLAL